MRLAKKSILKVLSKLLYTYRYFRKQTTKPVKEIRKEMQNVMRQITASVAILPLLDELCKLILYLNMVFIVSLPP